MSHQDRLQHLHILGATGSGKSHLLANIILQDIAAGGGVVVIDAKGDLVGDVLSRMSLADQDRLISLDTADTSRPVGLNLLNPGSDSDELVVESVVGIFHELYRAFWGPRSDDILRAAVATLVATSETYTLCELAPLLTEARFRRHVLSRGTSDPTLGSFWAWYEQLSDGERTQATAPVLNKLRAFTMRPRLRGIVGQSSGIRLSEVLAKRQVLLISLNSGLVGREAARLLGSLIVTQLWQATLQRAALARPSRHPVMVTIDEAPEFVRLPIDLGDMLAQARGLGVGLTLAHQHMAQLPPELRAGVLANARSRVLFRLDHSDAQAMSRELAPTISATDLMGLQRYEVALHLTTDNQTQTPNTGVTLDLPAVVSGQTERLRSSSAQRWGRDAAQVQADIEARTGRRPAGSLGREERG